MNASIVYISCHVADALIAWLYFESFLTKKLRLPFRILTFLIGNSLLYLFFKPNNIIINMSVFSVLYTVLVLMNYSDGLKTALIHSAFLNFICAASEIIMILAIGSFGFNFTAYTEDPLLISILAIGSRFLYLLVSRLGIFVVNRLHSQSSQHESMLLFWGMPIVSGLYVILIVYLGFTYELNDLSYLLIAVSLLGTLFLNLLFLINFSRFQEVSRVRLELELQKQKENADIAYYDSLQKQFENQRILVHDIKNHLSTISALAEEKHCNDILNYVSSLESFIPVNGYTKLCDNTVLNAILMPFRENCLQNGIDFHCDVRTHTIAFMDSASITALFANLLSNAFEAALGSKEHTIEFSIRSHPSQHIIVVSVVNSCLIPPATDKKGTFISRKNNTYYHGTGLKSIARITQKYNGLSKTYYDAEKAQFHQILQFPLF